MLTDSSGGLGVGEVAVQGGGEERGSSCVVGDQFTRRNADACLHCENSLSRETPGIPWPPKGGRLGDLGGTHSSQSQGS